MTLLKTNQDNDLLNWMINKKLINKNIVLYTDKGSVLSYALKYQSELFMKLLKNIF